MNTWIQGASTTDEVKKIHMQKKTQIRNKEGGSIEGICFLKHLLIVIKNPLTLKKYPSPYNSEILVDHL